MSEERKMIESVPDYLKEYTKDRNVGKEELLKVVRPPMLRIVQSLSAEPIKPPFDDGDVVITPLMIKIGGGRTDDDQEPFEFTPIFFFRHWFTWNPIQMKASLPAIRASSFDESGEIAIKAANPDTRKEPCPENPEHKLQHCEHLNYIVLIEHPDVYEVPILMSFSRAEYSTGAKLGSLIQCRSAPIYCCKFLAFTGDHRGNLGAWKGLEIENSPNKWVEEVSLERNEALFKQYAELHKNRAIEIEVDVDTSGVEEPLVSDFG